MNWLSTDLDSRPSCSFCVYLRRRQSWISRILLLASLQCGDIFDLDWAGLDHWFSSRLFKVLSEHCCSCLSSSSSVNFWSAEFTQEIRLRVISWRWHYKGRDCLIATWPFQTGSKGFLFDSDFFFGPRSIKVRPERDDFSGKIRGFIYLLLVYLINRTRLKLIWLCFWVN